MVTDWKVATLLGGMDWFVLLEMRAFPEKNVNNYTVGMGTSGHH